MDELDLIETVQSYEEEMRMLFWAPQTRWREMQV